VAKKRKLLPLQCLLRQLRQQHQRLKLLLLLPLLPKLLLLLPLKCQQLQPKLQRSNRDSLKKTDPSGSVFFCTKICKKIAA
jgi:hypothetical protein